MCGSSQNQNTVNNAQVQFYQTLQTQYQTEFAQNQSIMNELTSALTPIINAGASQEGYSPAEISALNTQAEQSAGNTYAQTATATNEAAAARGGGNTFVPTGTTQAIDAGIGVQAENQLANSELGIQEASYAQGQKNYDFAIGSLAGVPGIESANASLAGSTTGAGSAAASEANSINASNNSWLGVLGGLASSAVSGVSWG